MCVCVLVSYPLDHLLIIHEAEALILSPTLKLKTAKPHAQLRHLWLGVLVGHLTAGGLSKLVTTSFLSYDHTQQCYFVPFAAPQGSY